MAQQIRALTKGTLSGRTEGGQLAPVSIDFDLSQQDTHEQFVITVEPNDVLKPIALPQQSQQSNAKQTLFMAVTTGNVQVRLNGDDSLIFSLGTGGPLVIPGLPEITSIELTSLSPEEIKVSVTKIFGDTDLLDPGGGGGGAITPQLDKFSASAGQTVFTLSREPGSDPVLLFVEGVMYSSPTFFTISGSTMTWLDVPFTLPAGARVEVYYE